MNTVDGQFQAGAAKRSVQRILPVFLDPHAQFGVGRHIFAAMVPTRKGDRGHGGGHPRNRSDDRTTASAKRSLFLRRKPIRRGTSRSSGVM